MIISLFANRGQLLAHQGVFRHESVSPGSVGDPVAKVPEYKYRGSKPHCPGVNIVHQRLFMLCEADRYILQIGKIRLAPQLYFAN